jgi:hypothetical protein
MKNSPARRVGHFGTGTWRDFRGTVGTFLGMDDFAVVSPSPVAVSDARNAWFARMHDRHRARVPSAVGRCTKRTICASARPTSYVRPRVPIPIRHFSVYRSASPSRHGSRRVRAESEAPDSSGARKHPGPRLRLVPGVNRCECESRKPKLNQLFSCQRAGAPAIDSLHT